MSFNSMNKYWIPHLDIHKKVITQGLQYYLGPEATVRPYTCQVYHPLEPSNGRVTAWFMDMLLTRILDGREKMDT